jgi:hypothetical protein
MASSDGSFDETVEAVTASLSTAALADGRHRVYVQGRDSDGHDGPVSAAFFWVLDPATAPAIQGSVRSAESLLAVRASVTSGPFQTASDAGTGFYSLTVPEGDHDMVVEAAGYGAAAAEAVPALSGQITTRNFLLEPYCSVWADDMEAGNQGWTAEAPWALSTEASHSPVNAWSDSPGGSYSDDQDVSLTSPLLDLSGMANVSLRFWHIFDLEDGFDDGHVEWSTDGGSTWTREASFSGEDQTTWTEVSMDLPALAGENAHIRFRLITDVSLTHDGWHVDDVEVRASGPQCRAGDLIFADGFETSDISAWSP